MTVISNTTVISNFAGIGQLDLLRQLYQTLNISTEVHVARPSEEVLCEWVYFCYTFELFKESVELFNLINPEAVDVWPYERAKRIAKVCRIRANVS